MSNFKLSLPTDIPWVRKCVSTDMLERNLCADKAPPRWRSSIAVFEYEPEAENQTYDGMVITYLKVSCTITGYQEHAKEIGLDRKGVRSYWEHSPAIENYLNVLEAYYPCYGAVLEVAVGPENEKETALDDYPYFLDFEPKKRELYELVTDTGETMSRVSCTGWGDDSPVLRDNPYENPFWNETAFFTTSGGGGFRVGVYWNAAVGGTERGHWYGDKMSFFDPLPNGLGPIVRRAANQTERDDGGFERTLAEHEAYNQPKWWRTEMLPEPLRHDSGHDGSHTFLTHEFIDALINGRAPTVGIDEALNMTVPGIIAHQSALSGGLQMSIPVYGRQRN